MPQIMRSSEVDTIKTSDDYDLEYSTLNLDEGEKKDLTIELKILFVLYGVSLGMIYLLYFNVRNKYINLVSFMTQILFFFIILVAPYKLECKNYNENTKLFFYVFMLVYVVNIGIFTCLLIIQKNNDTDMSV